MRTCLFVTCLILWVLRLSAQSGGYLEFVENKGQWNASILYRADLSAGRIFIKKDGFTILQQDTNDVKRIHELMHGSSGMKGGRPMITAAAFRGHPRSGPGSGAADDPFLLHSQVYQVSFENSNPDVQVVGEEPFGNHNHYLNTATKASNCGVFQGLRIRTYTTASISIIIRKRALSNMI